MTTESACSLQKIPEESQRNATTFKSSLPRDTVSFNRSIGHMSNRPTNRNESLQLGNVRQSKQDTSKSHSRLQSLDSILHTEFNPTTHEGQILAPSTGSNAAALLASCRRSIQPDSEQPSVSIRTTSVARPSKRKRHEDYVAFHRQSCQLFSSIDSTLLQMRMSTLSSSASSSVSSRSSASSTPSSTPSSPDRERGTRETSIDSDLSDREGGSPAVMKGTTKPAKLIRPTLQRMPYTTPTLPVSSTTSVSNEKISRGTAMLRPPQPSNLTQSSSVPVPPSLPPKTTTQPCYSSQVALPFSSARNSTPGTNTVIQWTSPETRAQEYAKIDAANSGFRLFLRKVCPHTLAKKVGGGRTGFWNDRVSHNGYDREDGTEHETENCGGSIRRYRVENKLEEHDADCDDESDDTDSTDKNDDDEAHEHCNDFTRERRTQSWIPFLGRAKSMPVDMDSQLDEKREDAEPRTSISMMFRRISTYRL